MTREKLLFEMENGTSHLIIDGSAGTGKTTLIRRFQEQTKRKVIYLATTGIAAMLIKGSTIHGAFGFPAAVPLIDDVVIPNDFNGGIYMADTILIDEVSMLNCALLDALDLSMRFYKRDNAPFGGVRMIFVGDLYQIPPVVTTQDKPFFDIQCPLYKEPYYFFQSMSFQRPEVQNNLKIYSLATNYRQKEDLEFAELLLRARTGNLRKIDLARLNDNTRDFHISDYPVPVICMTNERVNDWNTYSMNTGNPIYGVLPQVTPAEAIMDLEVQGHPALEPLMINVGSRVMHTVNDYGRNLRNGTLATVHEIKTCDGHRVSSVVIRPDGRDLVEIPLHRFDVLRPAWDANSQCLKHANVASIYNFPLRLAYAFTVHKAQGQTMGNIYIERENGAFVPGQMYTGISRVPSMGRLRAFGLFKEEDFVAEKAVVEFLGMRKVVRVE